MDKMDVLRGLAGGNYHKLGGLRSLRIGKVDAALFADLLEGARELVASWPPSTVREGAHSTGWTRPVGQVQQWSLFNTHGRTDLTSDDFRYDNLAAKRAVGILAFMRLTEGLPDLVNLRLNLIGPESRLRPHEESLERPLPGDRVALRARFHLPLVTNDAARMLADGDLFHFEAGNVYLFNNGCVHAASNEGTEDRLHLVWDQLMTERALEAMFGDAPPVWLEQDIQPTPVVDTMAVTEWERQVELDEKAFYSRKLVVHP